AVNNRAKYNVRVLNFSLGHLPAESYKTDPLCQALEAAWKSGIVVVCAAGNAGRHSDTQTADKGNEGYGTAYGSILSPANDPHVITVSAMKSTDRTRNHDTIATYSSRGPSVGDHIMKPDLVAAGNQVISLRSENSWVDQQFGATNTVPLSSYRNNSSSAD